MKRNIVLALMLIAALAMPLLSAHADFPLFADVYGGSCGFGLTGHFIDSDGLIDIVATHEDEQIGGDSWLNQGDGTFIVDQSLLEGREAKFGRLLPNARWYLAIPDGAELNVYKVDQTNWELDLNQQITDYGVDYLFWGYVNGDNCGDVVATEYNLTHRVVIYHGNLNGTLDDPPHTFDPECDTQISLRWCEWPDCTVHMARNGRFWLWMAAAATTSSCSPTMAAAVSPRLECTSSMPMILSAISPWGMWTMTVMMT